MHKTLRSGARTWAAAALLVVTIAEPAPSQSAQAARMEAYFAACTAFGFSGVALVAKDGLVVFTGRGGLADRTSGRRIDENTLFEIASVTKPFTACAVMKLVEAGRIKLDDPISRHLSGVPGDKSDITVRHLLTHTSGMPRSAADGRGDDRDVAVAAYLKPPRAHRPGKTFEYWNGGFAILGALVERVSGKPFLDYCRENVFAPAGLVDTGFTGDAMPKERQAIGYAAGAAVRYAAEHPYGTFGWHYKGIGGIVASANDLVRFAVAFEGGRVLKPESVRLMQTESVKDQGLGWGVTTTARKTHRISHGGDVKGFRSEFQIFPEEKVVIVVLANTDVVPPWMPAWSLEAAMFDGQPQCPEPPALANLSDAELTSLSGTYASAAGERLVLERDGGGFLVGAEGVDASRWLSGGRAEAQPAVEVARTVIAALIAKDAAPIRRVVRDGLPSRWPDDLVSLHWPGFVAPLGVIDEWDPIGTQSPSEGVTEVTFAPRPSRGVSRATVVIDHGRLSGFNLTGPRFGSERRVAPTTRTRLSAFDWDKGTTESPLEVVWKDGRPVALVVTVNGRSVQRFEKS